MSKDQLEAFRAEYESQGLDNSSIQILDTVSRSDKVDAGLVAAVAAQAIADSDGDKGGVLIFCPGQLDISLHRERGQGLMRRAAQVLPRSRRR